MPALTARDPPPPSGPRVFISYAQFSDAHSQRVLALAQALRAQGIDADLDQFHQHELLDWPRWCQEGLGPDRSDWVLMVCTATYRDRLAGRVDPHTGKGAFWEGALIDDEIYAAKENRRFVPVLLDDEPDDSIPGIVRGWTYCRVRGLTIEDPGYADLYRLLTRQPAVVKRPLGAVRTLPPAPSAEPEPEPGRGASTPPVPDPADRSPADELDAARAEEERLLCAGEDTRAIQAQILDLRRRIRDGGALSPGYDLLGGRYRLIERVGQGGFATIWKALDRQLKRTVALKVLHHQYAQDRDRVERFFRGARKMADLQHPGIVRVHDSDLTDEGHRFFVMEYLPGGDLRRVVLGGTLGPERIPDLILAVGEALAYAHGRGLIHRDVKPANIVLDGEGRPRLTDFDLVRAVDTTGGTRTSMMGTFIYAAPELMENPQDADARADCFGLAMTAIFALHGRDLMPKDLLRHPEVFIGRLAVPEPVRAVLLRAIEWDLGERYPTVEGFCAAFAEAWRAGADAVVEGAAATAVDLGSTATVRPAPPPEPKPLSLFRDRLKDGSKGPELVWLPTGTFLMGSPTGDDLAYADERPQHEVRIGRPFALGRFPVTFDEYDRYCRAEGLQLPGDEGWGRDRRPVIKVSWNEASAYCVWLSQQTGRAYRLPSEAEWEYACRAGTRTRTRWFFGDDAKALGEFAWFDGNAWGKTHPVGEKKPNPWGLYDMHGNVWEWVQDHWHGDYKGAPDDGRAWQGASGVRRVLRGGGWIFDARSLRSACRRVGDPGFRVIGTGFRLALGPEPGQPSQ